MSVGNTISSCLLLTLLVNLILSKRAEIVSALLRNNYICKLHRPSLFAGKECCNTCYHASKSNSNSCEYITCITGFNSTVIIATRSNIGASATVIITCCWCRRCHITVVNIGLVNEGDLISIDIPNCKINVNVSDEELEERRKAWVCPEPRIKTGYAARYAKLVSSADKGAILM